jgi:dTDP-4-dehydrorhamnose 3,5-epimerase
MGWAIYDINTQGKDLYVIFTETNLKGAFVIEPEQLADDRGFFARTWCKREFETYGLNPNLVQCNISLNRKKGTIRGMHYQCAPYEEAKLVRCTKGKIHDVIIDLRSDSPTFKKWISLELSADSYKSIYIPEGFAHGFQSLEENTEVYYQMSEFYYPEFARGIRWNDPQFSVLWPIEDISISDKDRNWDDFEF